MAVTPANAIIEKKTKNLKKKREDMKNFIKMGLFAVGVTAAGATCALAQTEISGVRYYDFTHSIPMFAPKGGDITKPDLSKPFKNSKPVASFACHYSFLFPLIKAHFKRVHKKTH